VELVMPYGRAKRPGNISSPYLRLLGSWQFQDLNVMGYMVMPTLKFPLNYFGHFSYSSDSK
jgi:hypothetical protein